MDPDTKTGRPVIEVLKDKHPHCVIPDMDDPNNLAFADLGQAADPIPLDCIDEDVEKVATKLSGAAGCSSVDSALLKAM
eukprot:scaffold11430_cov126-Cyclotella_meneghiniana.AAC.1